MTLLYNSLTFLEPYLNGRQTVTNLKETTTSSCSSKQSTDFTKTFTTDSEGFLTSNTTFAVEDFSQAIGQSQGEEIIVIN